MRRTFSTTILSLGLFFSTAASLQVPVGCTPNSDATILSQSVFSVTDVTVPPKAGEDPTTNLTLTYFTCPGLGSGSSVAGTPIFLGNVMRESVANPDAFTWNCDQAPVPVPTLADCGNIDTDVIDSLIRPMDIVVPSSSGVIVSLASNTCAMVFLNTDLVDTYDMELEDICDMDSNIMEICPRPFADGFMGSVISERSPQEPGNLNWEVHIVSSSFLT
ncbi:hypothetical protein FB45DRAFT_1064339, partial [Roridomyces roridus]